MAFDPVSMGLMVGGTLFNNIGQMRIDRAQRRDIAALGASYDAERLKQQGLTGENEATVADTLNLYSRPASDARMAGATAARQNYYTPPIAGKDFQVIPTADTGGGGIIANRNAATGSMEQQKAMNMALAKGRLDAYGDAATLGNILAADNATKIGMVDKIKKNSQIAEEAQQKLMPIKMAADQNAGATWNAIGDWMKIAAGANTSMGNPIGNYFSGASASGAQTFAPGATGAPRSILGSGYYQSPFSDTLGRNSIY